MTHEEREQALSEEDYIELRHRFGTVVENVVRDMVSGKGERWEQAQAESEDAISREMALKECHDIVIDGERYRVIQEETLLGLPPVRQQEPKTEHWTALEEWKKDFKGFINELSMPKDDYNGIMEYIDEVPNEPKTGHWILTSDDDYEYCTCSECGYQNGENWMIGSQIKFCPNCGAKMD